MHRTILFATALLALTLTSTAGAHNWHPKPPVNHHPKPVDQPVTPATFLQVNRILACADQAVQRVGDNPGIAVDMTADLFLSGVYAGVKFTVARLYTGYGATCEKHLGGAPTGKTLDGYPVWSR
jgi:hypothetical protein